MDPYKSATVQVLAYGFQTSRTKKLFVLQMDRNIAGSRSDLYNILHLDDGISIAMFEYQGIQYFRLQGFSGLFWTFLEKTMPQHKSTINDDQGSDVMGK